ncbi:glycosyltransferase family 2 protein [Granulicella tundricola]|uniref:Glycosyl transferase family 2 n=1 Tax=Granulicella tundricola (strain ATCC BAA-1859 / DSM 23138 / MP5ACTX9) TaxID=1198114 RepID=E8X025_GRATM|nr:glycosyltransferase family 2 protein [Granulicella tundricola]ADW68921.1 glycosyl transferase family 2 [Granulicella tundricola MP5ACTX9]
MLILHVLLILLGIALLLATLPLVIELLALSLAALLPPKPLTGSRSPESIGLTVVIPAHNEERLIVACVRSIVSSSAPNVTVLVIAHNCTDATAQCATAAGAQALILNDTIGGKGTALHYGFTQALAAGADAVLVIDADSIISANLTSAVTAALAAGSQALQCRYMVANPGNTTRTRLMSLAFLGINVLRPRGRARLGLSCGIFGNGFALSAQTLQAVPYLANSVVEDLEYHLHLIRAGIRVDFLDHASVLGEMPDTSAASSTQRARWEGGRLLMRRQWTMPLLNEVLRGRLRMIEPLLDLRSLPLATEGALLLLLLIPSFWFPFPWFGAYATLGLCTLLLYILVAATLGPEPAQTLKALAFAPGYMLWKILMIPSTRKAARKDSAWVRTERNEP